MTVEISSQEEKLPISQDVETTTRILPSSHEKCSKRLGFFVLGFTLGLMLMAFCPYEPETEVQVEEININYNLIRFQISDIESVKCPRFHADNAKYTPEQLHLSLGRESRKEVVVTWSTMAPVADSVVYLRSTNSQIDYADPYYIKSVEVQSYTTVISEKVGKKIKNRTLFGYYANFTDLDESQYEYYVITSIPPSESCNSTKYFFSNSYSFNNPWYSDLLGLSQESPLRVAMFGDLGLINGQSIQRLIGDVDNNMYDAIIHNGDFGYDLNDALGTVGDSFMRSIEPIAARVMYQTSVGNHEVAQNFSHYAHRFKMVNTDTGDMNSFYYSFNLGSVHFVAYSTEFYYFLDYSGIEPLVAQYKWLEADLSKANSPEERALRPWIVVFGHRPMYCSSRDGDDCSKKNNILRKGLPLVGLYSLEKLFYEKSVDLVVEAHEHSYERFLPVYDEKIMPGLDNSTDPYLNPRAPVHIITGSAGCKENLDPFQGKPAIGSVKRISDYGYTRMSASFNQLILDQVSDDQDGDIVDTFTMTKTKLRNFP